MGILSEKLNDLAWNDHVARILSLSLEYPQLRKAWAFAVDQIARINPGIVFCWENTIRSWIKYDSTDQEYLIKLYRHMFNEFNLVSLF